MPRCITVLCCVAAVSAVHLFPPDTAASCSCMDWHEAYNDHGVKCGLGHEFTKFGGAKVMPFFPKEVQREFCDLLYERLPGNMCFKVGYQTQSTASWCYVDSECKGARPVPNSTAAIKVCKQGVDTLSSSKTIEELAKLAKESDIDMGLVLMLSFPQYRGAAWGDVEGFFMENGKPTKQGVSELDLQEVVYSQSPVFFDSGNGHPPHMLVNGTKVYRVDFSETIKKNGFSWDKPGEIEAITCERGCE